MALRAEQTLPGIASWADKDDVERQLACGTPSARATLGVLLHHADDANISGPSQHRIATKIKACKRTVIRAIQELALVGALVVVYERSVPTRTIAVYRLHPALVAAAREQRLRDLQRTRAARSWNARRRNVTQTTSSSFVGRRDHQPKHSSGSTPRARARCRAEKQPTHHEVAGLVNRLVETAAQYGAGDALCRMRAWRLVNRHGVAAVTLRLEQALCRPAWVRRAVKQPAAYLMACCARELPAPPSRERILAPAADLERRRNYAIGLAREAEHVARKQQAARSVRAISRTLKTARQPDDFALYLNAIPAVRERLSRDPWTAEQLGRRYGIPSNTDDYFTLVAFRYLGERYETERKTAC